MPILRAAELRQIEQDYADAAPPLMERAAAAAADVAQQLQAGLAAPPLIFAGPGNNGGDALVVARLLKERGLAPRVVFADSPERLPQDARCAYDVWLAAGGQLHESIPDDACGLIVDGLFGIGLTRPIAGLHAEWIARINTHDGPVLALDCPSGLHGDTGQVHGPVVRATYTVSFIAMKPGLLTLDGPDHCGEISVADLGLAAAVGAADDRGEVVTRELFAQYLRPRPRNSHKGSFGSAGILGGAAGMAGATLLAGRAALKLGAGRVYVGMLDRIAVDPLQPELMLRAADEVFALATVLAIGPGLGQSAAAAELLRRAIELPLPLVIDADALNLLGTRPVLNHALQRRSRPAVLTPHPAEAARLLGTSVKEVQADRVAAALALSKRSKAHVVLKGCGSVIALVDGRWYINATGNPGLATAGTGDVLTGMIAGLLAQDWPEDLALIAATHLHGCAADRLAEHGCGPLGLTAGELIDSARDQLNRWIAAH